MAGSTSTPGGSVAPAIAPLCRDRAHRADDQIRIGGAVDTFDLNIRGALAGADHAGDEAESRFAILDSPTLIWGGPALRDQAEVARYAGSADRREGRQTREQIRESRFALAGKPTCPVAVGEQIAPVAVEHRHVQVHSVAHLVGHRHWGERCSQAVAARNRTDRLAGQDRSIGGRDRIVWADRYLELAGRVLGVEQLDRHILRRQCLQQVTTVLGDLHQPCHAVRGPGRGRRAIGMGQIPLDFEAHPQGETGLRRDPDHPPSESPLIRRVRLTILASTGRPAPTPSPAGRVGRPVASTSGCMRTSPTGPPR